MSAPALDDVALVAAHRAGDPQAFDELVRRHGDRLWAVALGCCGIGRKPVTRCRNPCSQLFVGLTVFAARPH
ncbi:hypothetical protein ACFQV8_38270 [Pseudonocardia benzenivorans]